MKNQSHRLSGPLLTIAASLLFDANLAHASLKDFLVPTQLPSLPKKFESEVEVRGNQKYLSSSLLGALSYSANYYYHVEPSYQNGFYSRVDGWKLTDGLQPGDLLSGLPVSLVLEQGADVYFVRQFSSQKEAIASAPVIDPRHLPLSADLVDRFLTPGDLVQIPTYLNLGVSADFAAQAGIVLADASADYILSGKFTLEVYKVDNHRVRLRVIPQRSKETQVQFSVFSIGIVNKVLSSIVKLATNQLGASWTQGEIFVADFVYDLNSPEARQAYDAVIASTAKFLIGDLDNPLESEPTLESHLISDLTPSEEIFKADRDAHVSNPRVNRLFQASSETKQQTVDLQIGVGVVQFQANQIYDESFLSSKDAYDRVYEYYLPSYVSSIEYDFLFGLFKEARKKTIALLADTDDDHDHYSMNSYVIYWELKDAFLAPHSLPAILSEIEAGLPPEITAPIQWGSWTDNSKFRTNVQINCQIVMKREGFVQLRGISDSALKDHFSDYQRRSDSLHNYRNPLPQEQIDEATQKMLQELARVFSTDPEETEKSRIDHLIGLRHNFVFNRYGTGFLMSLLQSRHVTGEVEFMLQAKSSQDPIIQYTFANDTDDLNLFANIERLFTIVNNSGFDLRLETAPPDHQK